MMTASAADVHLTLPARAESVAVVRHMLGAFGDALALPRETLEDMRLAVTEACTNVVRHAYDEPDGALDVRVRPAPDHVDVVVADHGRGGATSPDGAGPGFGLPLMARLCDGIEIERAATSGGRRVTMTWARREAA